MLSSAELWSFPEQARRRTTPHWAARPSHHRAAVLPCGHAASPCRHTAPLRRLWDGGTPARNGASVLRASLATPRPHFAQVLRRFERFADLPPASYRFSTKHVLPRPGSENSAPRAGALAALPIDTALRRKLDTFLAPFNRQLALQTGIDF